MTTRDILFIDDDRAVLSSLGNYFERLGYDVFRAPSGADGIATWEREQPAVTVLDLHMPGMDGLQVLERLRERGATVIMLTGHGEIESAVRAMKLGAENFLEKPIDMEHLTQAVEKAAEKNSLRREVVKLRARMRPSLRRQLLRVAVFLAFVGTGVGVGVSIGGSPDASRPRSPIPVPLDTLRGGTPGDVDSNRRPSAGGDFLRPGG